MDTSGAVGAEGRSDGAARARGSVAGRPVLVVGCGAMGGAIVRGLGAAGLLEASRVVLCDPSDAAREKVARDVWGAGGAGGGTVRGCGDVSMAMGMLEEVEAEAGREGWVLLAVKPQSLGEAAKGLVGSAGGRRGSRLVISILAGVTTGVLGRVLDGEVVGGKGARRWRVVRAMPNLPAQVGMGATAWCEGSGASEEDGLVASAVFGAVGPTVVRIDESLMDAFTALAGSGPAYVFHLAEAMVRGGVAMGFDEATATALARATVSGAAELLRRDGRGPAELERAVTSKGGTTQAALEVLGRHGWAGAMVEAMLAARARGAELSRLASEGTDGSRRA